VSVDRAVVNMREEGGGATDRRGDFDPFVCRGDPPRGCAAARDAGNSKLGRIDFGPLREQVERADAVEQFNPRRGVTA